MEMEMKNKFISNEKYGSEEDELCDSYISNKLLEKNELLLLLSFNKELNEKILVLSENNCKNIANIDILTNKVNKITIEYNDYKENTKSLIDSFYQKKKDYDFRNKIKNTIIMYLTLYFFFLKLNLNLNFNSNFFN
jgi:hypothetical protein